MKPSSNSAYSGVGAPTAPAWRRLAAFSYDLLPLSALLFLGAGGWLIKSAGEVPDSGDPVFRIYLLAICWLYFFLGHRYGGQTIGMVAWKIRAVQSDGDQPLDTAGSLLRSTTLFATLATFGLGFLPAFVGRKTLHDWMARTRVVKVADE